MGPLVPALAVLGTLVVASAVFVGRGGRARFRDEEAERRVSGLTTPAIRNLFAWMMSPFLRALLSARIPANFVTYLSLVISLGAGAALATGRFALGGWLYFVAGACDFFDGRLARAQKSASAAGAALDSILDRYTEASILIGLAWFYRQSWVLVPTLFALVGSILVSYVRARGETLQANVGSKATMAEVGWLQRPERVVILGATVALSPAAEVLVPSSLFGAVGAPGNWLAVLGIVIIAVGTQLTAVQRTRHLVRALSTPDDALDPREAALVRDLQLEGAVLAESGVVRSISRPRTLSAVGPLNAPLASSAPPVPIMATGTGPSLRVR